MAPLGSPLSRRCFFRRNGPSCGPGPCSTARGLLGCHGSKSGRAEDGEGGMKGRRQGWVGGGKKVEWLPDSKVGDGHGVDLHRKRVSKVQCPAGTKETLIGTHALNHSGREIAIMPHDIHGTPFIVKEGSFAFEHESLDEEVESKDFVGTSKNLDRRIEDDTNMGYDTIGSNQLDMLYWRSKVDLSLTGVDTAVIESFFLWTGVNLSVLTLRLNKV
ncbi:hypothetical protein Taro_032948 [Colocasia esculenta]|uniref:Uncharacterized protein n=1 Tax=Colocasia esculenta TaxID=4460 RepID=A0A843W5E7_COLES|nr:hypothetical protein [Colocasia esculenta]